MKLDSSSVTIPKSTMGVYDAIYKRRSVKRFTQAPIPDEVIDRLLAAAIWAPNHRLTEPTRFFVIRRKSALREEIGNLYWQASFDKVVSPNHDSKKAAADAKRAHVVNAPAMIYVYSLDGETRQITMENYATACCAVQNIALAAVTEGFYMDWSTGGLTSLPGLDQMLGAQESWTKVGALFLAKPPHCPALVALPIQKWSNGYK